jgi:hypothetical protein
MLQGQSGEDFTIDGLPALPDGFWKGGKFRFRTENVVNRFFKNK